MKFNKNKIQKQRKIKEKEEKKGKKGKNLAVFESTNHYNPVISISHFSKKKKNFFPLIFSLLLFTNSNIHAQDINQKIQELSQQQIQLNTLQELNKTFPSEQELLKQERLKQYLFLNKKTSELDWSQINFSEDLLAEYINHTNNCLYNPETCLESKNLLFHSFYSYLNNQDKKIISQSIFKTLKKNNSRRNKIINIMLQELNKGVQEDINYNTSSQNYIKEYFIHSGSNEPELLSELGPYRETWAWCGAFVTSVLQKAGLSISFVLYNQYKTACATNSNKKNYSCNPVQADFVLSWAKQKNYINNLKEEKKIKHTKFPHHINRPSLMAGDFLIIEKNNIAQHIGFYLAQDNNYIYSLEGNVGVHINDFADYKQEYYSQPLGKNTFGKAQLRDLKNKHKLTDQQIERLYDRLTIVKRPKSHWDYSINYLE